MTALSDIKTALKFLHEINFKIERVRSLFFELKQLTISHAEWKLGFYFVD